MKYILILFLLISCRAEPDNGCMTGTINVTGNEPFAFLALYTDDNYYRIIGDDEVMNELWQMQGLEINNCDYDIELSERRY